MNTTQEKVVKHLVFPAKLAHMVEMKASVFGLSFAEYLRHLAVRDIEEGEVEYLDSKSEKEVLKSIKEYENGNYYTIREVSDLSGLLADSGKRRIKK